MIDSEPKTPASGRSWIILGAASLAGFIAAGTFATSRVTGVILVISLFIATFLGTLAHSILTEPEPGPGTSDEPESADSVSIEPV